MKTITSSTKNVPKLRFSKDENWTESKFYDLLAEVMDFRGKTPLKLGTDWGGDIPSLSALNVKMGYVDFKLDPHKGSEDLYRKWMVKGDLSKDDILFTMEAPLGNVALVPDDRKYILSQRVVAFKIKKGINNRFLYFLISSDGFQNKIKNLATGSTAQGINQRSFQKVKVVIPAEEEQEKIAEFLTAVDERLEKQAKKVELLKKYKKGLMQKIFSLQSRFKDENGKNFPDWEEKKLGEVAKFAKGSNIAKEDIVENGHTEAIRYGELYTIYKETIKQVYSKTNLDSKTLVFSKKNDVIIPASGETHIDIATASCLLKEGVALSGDINIIRTDNNGVFLAYYLNNAKRNDIAKLAQGVSVIHLYSSNLKDLILSIPSIEEQEKIADFLTSIEEKIEAEEKKLEQGKKFKKFLLQNMFI